ncbi:MAG: DUF2079 domain-containing protein [Myxococcales bacterium]|nr:DUF2079 domain-containing protein [Myxococcales bacterium]MCB9701076.1 DUF2079 domain-containing protein [Myxococcales bacterium]
MSTTSEREPKEAAVPAEGERERAHETNAGEAPEGAPAPAEATKRPGGSGGRAEALLAALGGWLPWALVIAAAPAFFVWPLVHRRFAGFVLANDLNPLQRAGLLATIVGSIVIVGALYLVTWQRRRRSEPTLPLAEAAGTLNRRLLGLLALPFAAALLAPKIESERPIFTLLNAALAAVFVAAGAYHLGGWRSLTERLHRALAALPRWLPITLVTAIFAAYSALLSRFALIDHRNIWTQFFDLGIYDNILWHTLHGDFLGSSVIAYGKHWAAHFDPILALLVPFYALAPNAETLLIIQAIWLGSAVFPIYLLARDRLQSRWIGVALALALALHPALHGVNMFDFHSLALAIPLMCWAVYLVDRRSWLLWPALALLLACREDMALLACFIGAYALLGRRLRVGLGIIAGSIAYLAFVKLAVMPDAALLMQADNTYSYASFYSEMIPRPEEGVRGLVLSLVTNPIYALGVLCKEEKLIFMIQLLLPLAFLPLFAGRARILWLYGMAFIGLASRPHVFALNFQYSAVLFPMLFAATPQALAKIGESPRLRTLGIDGTRARAAAVAAILAASTLVSWKFGVLVENTAFKAGWQPLTRDPDAKLRLRADRTREMVAKIPADAAVSASSEIGPQLSNRERIYRWPDVRDAEYMLLGAWRFNGGERARLDRQAKTTFEVIDEHDGVILLKRREGSPAARADAPARAGAPARRTSPSGRPPR